MQRITINLNVSPHAFPHALPYLLPRFSMVWGYLQQVTTIYRQIWKNVYINILFFWKKMALKRCNLLQIASFLEKMYGNICGNAFKFGNGLDYDLSIFVEFAKSLRNVLHDLILVRFHKPSHLFLLYLLNK